MAGQRETLEETIDRLYGLPLDEFTAARDAAAKDRRAEKDRDGAEALRRLRKPNLVAWSINRACRSDPEAIEELIAAGERLSEAQRNLVMSGERGSLREAAADERAQVGRVAALAAAELEAAGHAAEAGMQSKLFATLHAAAASAEVSEQLALGRLVRDHELSDLGLGDPNVLVAAPKPAPKQPGSKAAGKTPSAPKPSAAERARERKRQAVSERIARARDRRTELAAKADAAGRAARDAERAAREATQEAERARAAAEKAARETERAAQNLDELEAELASLG